MLLILMRYFFCFTLRKASLFVGKMRWMWPLVNSWADIEPNGRLSQMLSHVPNEGDIERDTCSFLIINITGDSLHLICVGAGGALSNGEDRVVWRLAVGWPLLCLIAVGALERDEEYRCGPSGLVFNQCFPSERGPRFHCADQASFCLEQPQDRCSLFIILFTPLQQWISIVDFNWSIVNFNNGVSNYVCYKRKKKSWHIFDQMYHGKNSFLEVG